MKRQNSIRITAIVLLMVVTVFAAARNEAQSPGLFSRNGPSSGVARVGNFVLLPGPGTVGASDFLTSEPSGWENIMPRGSFHGWTRVAIPPDKPLDPTSQWSLDRQNGTIVCDGDRGHEWLRYDRELANFLLHVEWRFDNREGLKGYNSGVFVGNSRDGRVWHQAQVGARAYLFGQTLVHDALSPITQAKPMPVDPLHPIGEWNTYEIRCDGAKITLWVNGILTSEFAAPEVLKGYLGLEAEGYRIAFRNIRLKTLP